MLVKWATKGSCEMVELVYGLHHVTSGGDQGKFLSSGASTWTSPRESKGGGVRGWLYHRCTDSNRRSPGVVKLEVGLHRGCFIRKQEVSRGGEASDEASPQKIGIFRVKY